MTLEIDKNRRPISSRETGWAKKITKTLIAIKLTPNSISVWSIIFSILGALSIFIWPIYGGLIFCAIMIQMRLLCNLFDGMVAIELNKPNPIGKIYNEFPDRITDSIFLIAIGYAVNQAEIGMLAALLATLTAYIRVLGGSVNLPQRFDGVMAKQHRMAVLTIALIAQQIESYYTSTHYSLIIALWIIILGSALTCISRTYGIAVQLQSEDKETQK